MSDLDALCDNIHKNCSLNESNSNIEEIHSKILDKVKTLESSEQKSISLLLNKDVLRWIQGDLSFLPEPENKVSGNSKNGKPKYEKTKKQIEDERKKNEDAWNIAVMKEKRPDLSLKTQSKFGPFGEELCKEYFILTGKFDNSHPKKMNGHQLDLETKDEMIESKCGSYYTTGTAGEKILGVPYKYADVYRLYNKPLRIICIGKAEAHNDLVYKSDIPEREKMKTYWKDEFKTTFIGFRELINSF